MPVQADSEHIHCDGFLPKPSRMAFVFEFIHKAFTRSGNSPEIMIFQLGSLAAEWPIKVRPHNFRSGRALNKASSTRKYSCSHPKFAVTFSTSLSKYWQMPGQLPCRHRSGPQHRRFIIRGFARIGHEYRRYTQGCC